MLHGHHAVMACLDESESAHCLHGEAGVMPVMPQ